MNRAADPITAGCLSVHRRRSIGHPLAGNLSAARRKKYEKTEKKPHPEASGAVFARFSVRKSRPGKDWEDGFYLYMYTLLGDKSREFSHPFAVAKRKGLEKQLPIAADCKQNAA